MAPAHRVKRQYQQDITSFFRPQSAIPTSTDALSDGQHDASDPLTIRPPEPPAHVQASLLSVGMRVRKSVPEGYKTHKTMLALSPTLTRAKTAPPTALSAVPAELTPFCGIHKVGGLGVQPQHERQTTYTGDDIMESRADAQAHAVDAHAVFTAADFAGLDDGGWWPSSQESMASTISTDSMPIRSLPSTIMQLPQSHRASRKRSRDSEGDDGEEFPQSRQIWPSDPAFLVFSSAESSSSTIARSQEFGTSRNRRMKAPLSRSHTAQGRIQGRLANAGTEVTIGKPNQPSSTPNGQENVHMTDDFGEAAFLRFGDADMSGV